jgi:enterochelin esterase-like enzyme
MRKRFAAACGEVITLEHTSRVLQNNPLNDPHVRRFHVWLPPGYSPSGKRRYPVLYDLTGYTGSGFSHTNWKNFDENVPEQLDRLHDEGRLGGVIVVFPDCFTALGGNQYINSSAVGRYADYLTRELVPFVDQTLATKADRAHRGCFGKSSGGYGAMVHGCLYADTWGGVANHSGDAYFDFVYRTEWPAALTHLHAFRPNATPARTQALRRGQDDGRVAAFLEHLWSKRSPSGMDISTLMMVCMAATYDPDPKAPNGFRLPFDMHTGELIESRWKRWLAHDPVHLVAKHTNALRSLKALFIDCGWRDQYHIHFGSRQLSARLDQLKVKHRYEEFDGTHSGIDYRMDVSLPYLYRALR